MSRYDLSNRVQQLEEIAQARLERKRAWVCVAMIFPSSELEIVRNLAPPGAPDNDDALITMVNAGLILLFGGIARGFIVPDSENVDEWYEKLRRSMQVSKNNIEAYDMVKEKLNEVWIEHKRKRQKC